MNIALRSEDWQLFLAASTIQQCQSGSDFTIQRREAVRIRERRHVE
jgi:hypothetical protein